MHTTALVGDQTLEMAGYFAAHAVLSVSDGHTLVPILGFEFAPGQGEMHRLFEVTPREAQALLDGNSPGAARAVLILDARMTRGSAADDGLILEMVDYRMPRRRERIAVPYRHASAPGGFAVLPVMFLDADDRLSPAPASRMAAFLRGVERHDAGGALWRRHAVRPGF
jgi:hypothetical protein